MPLSANNATLKYEGDLFECGDQKLVIPPLSTGQVRLHFKEILAVSKEPPSDMAESEDFVRGRLDQKIEILRLACSRNYPEITCDDLYELVNLQDLDRMLVVALGQSMSPKVKQIEGEIQPVAQKK